MIQMLRNTYRRGQGALTLVSSDVPRDRRTDVFVLLYYNQTYAQLRGSQYLPSMISLIFS